MQKKISLILFCLSLLLLFQSLSTFLLPRAQSVCPQAWAYSTQPDSEKTENIAKKQWSGTNTGYSAGELGCTSSASTPTSLYAKAYCVIDADSGRILCGKQENEQMPMASTTKIMTCILALESGRLDDTVTVSSYAASMPDVQLNIREGETYCLRDLLYSLMLESHNDTAVAIAEHLGGSVEGFAEMMNKKAAELGCTDTHFVTPNGLDADEHYTTAKELCVIAAYAIQNKDFLKVIATPSYSFHDQAGKRSFTVNNHDAFLRQYPGAIGVKTGFTGKAGYCFCGAAKQKGKILVSAVLACGWPPNKTYKWADTKKLMNYGFNGYEKVDIPINTEEISLPVENGQQGGVVLRRNTDPSVTLPLTKTDRITYQRELPESLTAPVRAGDIVGYENYSLNGDCFLSVALTAEEDIAEIDYNYWARQITKLFFGR